MTMKRTLALVLALLMVLGTVGALAASSSVRINRTNFPDATFRKYVRQFDKNKDGKLSQAERNAIKAMDLKEMNIRNLKGIQYFSRLQELDTSSFPLSSIDLSGCPRLKKIIKTHIIVERLDSDVLGWRLGYPHPLLTHKNTVLKDGSKILYKPGRVRSIRPVSKNVTLKVGQLWLPAFNVTPSTAACCCTISVKDDNILDSPYDDGTKKALKKGTTTVTIKTEYGQTATIKVKVK